MGNFPTSGRVFQQETADVEDKFCNFFSLPFHLHLSKKRRKKNVKTINVTIIQVLHDFKIFNCTFYSLLSETNLGNNLYILRQTAEDLLIFAQVDFDLLS